jgi:hypothetical protein
MVETDFKNNPTPQDPKDTGGDYLTPFTAGSFSLTSSTDIQSYSSQFEFISPPVEKIIFEFSTAEFIEERIGVAFNLSREQKKHIANIIRELLLGSLFIGDFISTVKTKLNVDDKKAGDIVSMIVAELFPPAIESIKRIQRIKFPNKIQELAKSKPAAPAQQGTVPPPSAAAPKPQVPEIKKETVSPQMSSQPQSMRPPVMPQGSPKPSLPPLPGVTTPPANRQATPPAMPKPAVPPPAPKPSVTLPPKINVPPATPAAPQSPPSTMAAKPEFKIPDLGSSSLPPPTDVAGRGSSIPGQNLKDSGGIGTLPNRPAAPAPSKPAPPKPVNATQGKPTPPKQEPIVFKEEKNKSIDEELDKIANVIDLRSQGK